MTVDHSVFQERLEESRTTYKLNLGYCNLTELPEGFVNTVLKYNANIVELDLTSNKLKDLPDDLLYLKHLRTVRLKYNAFQDIPSVLLFLEACEHLDMAGNQISELPEDIARIQTLRELDVSGNRISAMSDKVSELANLHTLHIENNELENLPEAIGKCPALVKLFCSTNLLRKLPASLGAMRKIQRLDFSNNLIVKVPPVMGHLQNLKELNLRYNRLDPAYQAAADEGLSRFLQFLRKEEEREDQEERERLRPVGTQVGAFMEYRCKAKVAHGVGKDAVEVDNRPWTREGATLCRHHDKFYLFGGTVVRDGRKTNDVFWLSVDRMEWHRQPCKGDSLPAAREGHCAIIDPHHNTMVVFGGRNQDKRRLNDVHVLDLDTFTWYKQTTSGTPPLARDLASAVFWEGCMLVFGGHAVGSRQSDLMRLDLSTWKWSVWGSTGAPSPRESAAMCVGHGNMLFLHGGCNNFGLDDLWVFDCRQSTWTQIQCEGQPPPIRRNHNLFVHKDHLYMFGGFDTLGSPSCAMYRVRVDYTTNFATEKIVWDELISDRHFNKNRMPLFYASDTVPEGKTHCTGHLSCFQLGSKLMGHANDEDVEKGNVYWDIHAVADVEAFQVKAVDADMLKPKNGKQTRIDHTTNQAGKVPRSFTMNSKREDRMLAYLQDFQKMFTELYRHRRPLLLAPKNECGVPKFVCTTIRPTKMQYEDLYMLEGIIQFVSNFVEFEPLENPLHMPEFLLSPASTISFQAGDAFDMSTLLASLLIGVGYDAYVVAGYAPDALITNDQSRTTCPIIEAEQHQAAQAALPASSTDNHTKKGKYRVKKEVKLESEFLAKLALEAEVKGEAPVDKDQSNAVAATPAPVLGQASEKEHRLVHAWVMVKAGERDVTADVFIDCASGRKYSPQKSPFCGVEYIWNHQNFWVCMQQPQPHSDSRAHPSKVNFDLTNTDAWESVLPREPTVAHRSKGNSGKRKGHGHLTEENLNLTRHPHAGDGIAGSAGAESNAGAGTAGSVHHPSKPKAADGGSDQRSQVGSHARDTAAPSEAGVSTATALTTAERKEAEFSIDMPESWVPALSVPRDMLDMRVPKGNKRTAYQYEEHEIFALFGECSRDWDGMVERLTIFADVEHKHLLECREYFFRRRDKLRERRLYYEDAGERISRKTEYFGPGSAYSVKQATVVLDLDPHSGKSVETQRTYHYYSSGRLDSLSSRDEQIGVKTVERFKGRDDKLWYRSVTYGSHRKGDAAHQAKTSDRHLPIIKMTEKFERNCAAAVAEDVAKRTYYIGQESIRIDYHIAPDRLTNSYRIYTKDGHSHVVEVDALAQKVQPLQQVEQFQELLQAEKDCTMEQDKQLVTPYYDITRVKAAESDDEKEEVEQVEFDYLSPFLPKVNGTRSLNREEALKVREDCLKALKDRLIERANVIQARYDEETAALAKRQANFQRDRDQLGKDAEKNYETACEESAFRVTILQKRLKRHEEQALHKYYELDNKLRKDPRLATLLQSDNRSGL